MDKTDMKRSKPRILAIDDTPANLMTLGAALSKDYELHFATSGQEGLDQALAARPDLILLDVMMPEMDGFEFLVEMRGRAEWRDIPVLVVTAKDLTAEERSRLNGDVARVLNQMATELRRRLLSAGMGEALLSQLVEALPCACVIFEENGQLVACNGAGRRALHLSGPEAGARMNEFAEHPQVQGSLKVAENDGKPEPIRLDLTYEEPLQGLLHVLKRPGMAPLRVSDSRMARRPGSWATPPGRRLSLIHI